MVLINGEQVFATEDESKFLLASPEDIKSKGDQTMQKNEQGKSKREQRDLRVLQEFMEENEFDADDVKKLLKELDGTEEQRPEKDEQRPESKEFSEDDAVTFLLTGDNPSNAREEAAVNQLLGR